MNALELQNGLRDIFEELIDARGDIDDPLADIAERVDSIRRISTFEEASILTTDKGLVIECNDGSEFRITIVRSK